MEKDIVKRTFALAEKHRKPVYAVVSNMSIAIERRDFLRSVHCFICNQQEAGHPVFGKLRRPLARRNAPHPARQNSRRADPPHGRHDGAQGAVFATLDGEDGYCPAKKVDVKDTTGAGDAFRRRGHRPDLRQNDDGSCEIGTRLAASVITTGENVCPRYLPSEFGWTSPPSTMRRSRSNSDRHILIGGPAMKKALFLALSLAFLLTACGETTLPDTSEQNRSTTRRKRRCPRAACSTTTSRRKHFGRGQISPARAERGRRVSDLLQRVVRWGVSGPCLTGRPTAAFPSPT